MVPELCRLFSRQAQSFTYSADQHRRPTSGRAVQGQMGPIRPVDQRINMSSLKRQSYQRRHGSEIKGQNPDFSAIGSPMGYMFDPYIRITVQSKVDPDLLGNEKFDELDKRVRAAWKDDGGACLVFIDPDRNRLDLWGPRRLGA